MADWGDAPWVQLPVSAGNGWPHNALRHHWLMPIRPELTLDVVFSRVFLRWLPWLFVCYEKTVTAAAVMKFQTRWAMAFESFNYLTFRTTFDQDPNHLLITVNLRVRIYVFVVR